MKSIKQQKSKQHTNDPKVQKYADNIFFFNRAVKWTVNETKLNQSPNLKFDRLHQSAPFSSRVWW